jgi:hypothetical protein
MKWKREKIAHTSQPVLKSASAEKPGSIGEEETYVEPHS